MVEKGTLYVIATPIGNLKDISLRAIEILSVVDWIAAEDTRHSRHLLQHFSIQTPLRSLHEHNEQKRIAGVLGALDAGESVALVSDAGTPLICDPGYSLVKAVREAGFLVKTVPGASALIAALSISGLASDRFFFEGFLPAKSVKRQQRLSQLKSLPYTVILYESCHRILAMLEDLQLTLGNERQIAVARELTKTFESVYAGSVLEVLQSITSDSNRQKGEFVVVIGVGEKIGGEQVNPEALRVLDILLVQLPIKQASQLAAKITGFNKRRLYDLALERKAG